MIVRSMQQKLPDHSDSRYHDAALSVMESADKGDKPKYKKYIFKIAGKFSKTPSNK